LTTPPGNRLEALRGDPSVQRFADRPLLNFQPRLTSPV